MSQRNSYSQNISNRVTNFTLHGDSFMPPFELVTSVSAIPFTQDGRIVIVRLTKRGLDIPGGHVEPYETTPLETLNREVMEEATMTIRDAMLAKVIESDFYDDKKSYLLLYTCFVNELFKFEPNDESSERLIMTVKEFIDNYNAGDKELMEHVITNAWKKIKNVDII